MKFIKTPVKGMCDMLPADMRLREHVLGMIKETYGACGFMQIETPVNLSSKQKQLLRDFEASLKDGGNKHNPKTQSFFDRMKSFFG